jgi:PAS domain S-box-containing protein
MSLPGPACAPTSWSVFFVGLVVAAVSLFLWGRLVSKSRSSPALKQLALADAQLRESQERLRLLVDSVHDYAIFMLDRSGHVLTWNSGAQRLKGYSTEEIVGKHFSLFYPPEDVQSSKPQSALDAAARDGRFEDEGWRLGKDGVHFWANGVISAVKDAKGELVGFAKVTRDLTERKQAEIALGAANRELEAFNHSVAHDLRAPLRAMNGFAQLLLDDYDDKLEGDAQQWLRQISAGAGKMSELIDALLSLSQVSRAELKPERVDLGSLVRAAASHLAALEPERAVEVTIESLLPVEMDPRLARSLVENLVGNAWKFTGKTPSARIDFGTTAANGVRAFFVRDNGAGFDMAFASKLFSPFQRLHAARDFPGTGIGLATVQRIVRRHGGHVWAEGTVGQGATIYFTLAGRASASPPSL